MFFKYLIYKYIKKLFVFFLIFELKVIKEINIKIEMK